MNDGKTQRSRLAPAMPLPLQLQIDRLCDEYERRVLGPDTPRIEDLLEQVDEPLREYAFLQLLALEWKLVYENGAKATPAVRDELRQRFPAYEALLDAEWQRLHDASQALSTTAPTGHDLSVPAQPREAPRWWSKVGATPPAESVHEPVPAAIGRFTIRDVLGEGGFGRVYLAHDSQLDRHVAVKVPNARWLAAGVRIEAFLNEARQAARLKHPALVTVHEVQLEHQPPYIVQEYIDGQNLASWMQRHKPSLDEVVRLMIEIVEAVGFAHSQGLVHRDLKPGNILIDADGHAHVADFGLAIHETAQRLSQGELAGTPAYMSPEQARGETHRLDGRADLWSLGVIFYELLTGRRPFLARDNAALLQDIATVDPRPIRQLKPKVPSELERICLKCLEKRRADRYATAADLVEDLQFWREHQQSARPAPVPAQNVVRAADAESPGRTARIMPKGLKSFDRYDAEFFLELLPGPRNRSGVPESIRFWKTRIEEADADIAFPVGLIYGPTGCGKSSFVKAGLLPRLEDRRVVSVYIEATPADTEARLVKRLGELVPSGGSRDSLPAILQQLRQRGLGGNRKLLIVIDQFEQWLHSRGGDEAPPLLDALRHCDGVRIQCLLLVRDDFWLALSRFMRDLEVPLVEGHNSALVDLFDREHARKILLAFGQAYHRLPESALEMTGEQADFLNEALDDLAERGKVICARLALFAQMMKDKPWTTTSLRKMGGAKGVGTSFLEETFSASSAPIEHRKHQKAARALLGLLLPEIGTDIKGGMRSQAELLQVSGYDSQPRDFAELLRILDTDLRLITPTDPDGRDVESLAGQVATTARYFQLTHDFLVPSLREWLTSKQRETRRGRAELRLDEHSAAWNIKPHVRHLPSGWEFLSILCWTVGRKPWTAGQRSMMRAALRYYGLRWTLLGAIGLVLVFIAYRAVTTQQQYVAERELENDRRRAASLVESVLVAPPEAVPYAIEHVRPLAQHARQALREYLTDTQRPASQRLHAACALADLDDVHVDFLVAAIDEAKPAECANLVTALERARPAALAALRAEADRALAEADFARRARLAIVALHLQDTTLAADMLEIAARTNPIQRTLFIREMAIWHGDVARLAPLVAQAPTPALRSGLSLGLGGIPTLDDAAREAWRPVLLDWHQQRPDAVTHAAVGWTLRQWKWPDDVSPQRHAASPGKDWMITSQGLTLLRIPAGRFVRSDSAGARRIQEEVTLSREFWLSHCEITVALFEQFLQDNDYTGPRPSAWQGDPRYARRSPQHPIRGVSWNDAVMFCNWLSQREQLSPCYDIQVSRHPDSAEEVVTCRRLAEGTGYRLPTEAEWEYACAAGTTTAYCSGDEPELLEGYAVYRCDQDEPVGSRRCNGWGLFDMHGNEWEWCEDWYGPYGTGPIADPSGPAVGESRVFRGGSAQQTAGSCSSSSRANEEPSYRGIESGFRVALSQLSAPAPAAAAREIRDEDSRER